MIEGVNIHPLKVFRDKRGWLMHMMRSTSPSFKSFGEIYFSTVYPKVIKGWKKHMKMTQNFAVPIGNIKLVIYDNRKDSPTKSLIQEIFIGVDNYQLVTIPPLLWYAFQAISDSYALIANCTDMPYDPDEIVVLDPFDKQIPYIWK